MNNISPFNTGNSFSEDRLISFGPNTAKIPERLLLAHAKGEVLFIAGAGISQQAGLPDFRNLVIEVYKIADAKVHSIINSTSDLDSDHWEKSTELNNEQKAEVRRFIRKDYDVVLGMLERRMDLTSHAGTRVRKLIADILHNPNNTPASIHKSLVKLSNRGAATTIITTNFDLLLEKAQYGKFSLKNTYSLGAIPRPTKKKDFSGILHIHGALHTNASRNTDLVITDHDFGEFYLRRRVVPDFIYDAARLFNLVLVGYTANDPPMRYLLNAVAADGSRFTDLKERYTFVGSNELDPVLHADWNGRGIFPIHYNSADGHEQISNTLKKWSEFSAINGNSTLLERTILKIVRNKRINASESERDLFDHLIRRSSYSERSALSAMISNRNAEIEWLNAIISIASEDN